GDGLNLVYSDPHQERGRLGAWCNSGGVRCELGWSHEHSDVDAFLHADGFEHPDKHGDENLHPVDHSRRPDADAHLHPNAREHAKPLPRLAPGDGSGSRLLRPGNLRAALGASARHTDADSSVEAYNRAMQRKPFKPVRKKAAVERPKPRLL